jgi:hypothetical protein
MPRWRRTTRRGNPAITDHDGRAAFARGPVNTEDRNTFRWPPSTATPGASLFVSATLGQLDTAATTGGTAAVATVDYISQDGSTPHAVLFVTRSTY